MNCEVCGKFFSGEVPWKQHLSSEKHKKKIAYNIIDYPKQTDLKATQSNQYDALHCPVCNVTCDSIQSFQMHALSLEHATNVSKKNNQKEEVDAAIGIPSIARNDTRIDDELLNSLVIDETDKILPDMTSHKISQMSSLSCAACNKHFSGPEPYKQHIESAVHKKKIEFQNSFGGGAVQNALSPLFCDACKKMFSGKVPYEQHINSDTHKKKVQNLQFLEKWKADSSSSSIAECDSSGDASNRIGDVNRFQMEDNHFFCKLCNVPCSGIIPYRQHVSGEMHMKHLKRIELSGGNVSSLEYKSADSQFSRENLHSSIHSLHSSVSNVDTENIITEMARHLEVGPIEEPKLKVFLPEDKVNLDELQNNENQDPLENKSDRQNSLTTQDDEIQKVNTDVYHECQYCKVNLKNKKEALAHFESVEHFSRKWQLKGLQ